MPHTPDRRSTAAVTLRWLGQAGFALRAGQDGPAANEDQLLLIDPYLSDTLAAKYRGTRFPHVRLHPAPVPPGDLRDVAAVLCTHGHTDHMDPGTIKGIEVHNTPEYVVPRAERRTALERGAPAERLTGVDAGERVTVAGVRVEPVPAAHEELRRDEHGNHHCLGYVITLGGLRVYHSGDCVPYDGQADLLRALGIDLALLPVNGRDAYRTSNGVPGNFSLAEAVDLCRAARIPRLLCHHFGLFDFNTADPDELRARLTATADGLAWTVPEVGATYRLTPDSPDLERI
ncbi:MBL fold metallo-hydrolase [Streptomyces sp. HUAS MG91]|uniref:MBL fold metallo-hydrolase n=1 Tax=Streptomyces tabacisoli TaxID=3156398 RepID=A0AAU8J3M8_9ACTN